MSIRIGDTAPNFDTTTQLGAFNFHDYLGDKWGVLFSHPRDFTPVCATELGRAAQLSEEWAKRNVKIVGLSVDSKAHHDDWIKDINEIVSCDLNFPVIADEDRKVANLWGMLDQTHLDPDSGMPLTVRSVFIVDPDKKIRLILTYPAATGRNFDEILRVIDSLQMTSYNLCATPADWTRGSKVVVLPTVSTEEAKEKFTNVDVVRPWIRYADDPSEVDGKDGLELIYFQGPGRAELTRLILHAGNYKFTDTRLASAEFGELKASNGTVFGSLPMLKHRGATIAQSQAIAQYAAELALNSRSYTALDRATVGMYMGVHADIQSAMYACLFGDDDSKAAAKTKLPAAVERYVGAIENLLPAQGFVLGGRLSAADLAVFDVVTSPFPGLLALGQDLAAFPKVLALVEKVKGVENLQAYLKARSA